MPINTTYSSLLLKKLLSTLCILALFGFLTPNSDASVARLAVLGTQPEFTNGSEAVYSPVVPGSLWYDDNFNMFYNPSHIMDHGSYATFHKGNITSGNNGGEGGWVSTIGKQYAYGLYFNRGNSSAIGTDTTARLGAPGLNSSTNQVFAGNNNVLNTRRALDLLVGGDHGFKWGAKLTWAYNRDQSIATQAQDDLEATARYWHLALGGQYMGFEPFLGTTFSTRFERNNNDRSAAATDVLEDMNIGLRYRYESWTPYLTYRHYRRSGNGPGISDPTTTVGDTQVQGHMKIMGIGVGKSAMIAKGVDLLANLGFYYTPSGDSTNTNLIYREMKQYVLPLNLGVEADVATWFTLRAGVEYYFWNEISYDSLG
ncbi:MAG TPA: hypothetical protein PLH57_12030, partial [Oligoflexia bacterium]|nr:hypothetical protein [Oligoflexia bacterium]